MTAYTHMVQGYVDDLADKRKGIIDAIVTFTNKEMEEANYSIKKYIGELKSIEGMLQKEGRQLGLIK